MGQLTLRIPDSLGKRLKVAAGTSGKSVNRWATDVLHAAVDPDLAGDEAAVLRERLARAGLLVQPEPVRRSRPRAAALARARAAAGRGRRPSELVSEGRR
jgi:plasmid stability protein